MGNTCYANATIQAFRACPRVNRTFEVGGLYTRLFQKEPAPKRAKQQALAASFAEIIQLLWKSQRGQRVHPADFWKQFVKAVQDTGFEHLATRMPHDSHEFYLFLLDTLHESMAQKSYMQNLCVAPKTEAEKHRNQAVETWRKEFENAYSPLVDIFYGLQHVVVRCKKCGSCSHSWEVFSALKAQVPKYGQPATLQAMLEEEFKPETMEGYACDACAPTRTEAEKSVRLWRMPLNVLVVLKRFTFDGTKIHTPCAPIEGAISFQPFFSEESPEREGCVPYSICSIVDHHGGSNGGHYTAQSRTENGTWVFYDDEMAGSEQQAPLFGSSTYMLFFTKEKLAAKIA
jgi:ubiquitin C-terminal hydrolase